MDPYEFAIGERDGHMVMANRWGETSDSMTMEQYWEMRRETVQYLGQQGIENPRVPVSLEPITDNVPSSPAEVEGLLWQYRLGR